MESVTLSWREVYIAARAGVARNIRAQIHRRSDRNILIQSPAWDIDIEGACAEMAAGKLLGLEWRDDPALDHDGDLPGGWHVRSTAHEAGHLLVYANDPSDGKLLLAVGRSPTFRFPGYITGSSARRPEWWSGDRLKVPAWMVPQASLLSIGSSASL